MNAPSPAPNAALRALLWRIHFWAALVASPFAVVAAVTGLLYVFTPQVESVLHGALDRVPQGESMRPLDEAVLAATPAAPAGWRLHSVVPPQSPTESVKVAFVAPGGAAKARPAGADHDHSGTKPAEGAKPAEEARPAFLRASFGIPGRAVVVYVDPYTTRVLGQLRQSERFREWSRKLHSTYLQDGWRWMIELAASWLMVMLVTGLVLGWPKAGEALVPRRGAGGRVAWKQWHAFLGIVASAMSAIMLLTGLTWSQYAGDQVKRARDAAGQEPPRIPATLRSMAEPGARRLTWQQALEAVRREAPDVQAMIQPPMGPAGFWRASHLDRGQPDRRFDLLLDQYSGKRLFFSGWDDLPAFGKATGIGIPFHRGEFGWWNQALLVLFGVGVLFSIASGWVMYFKRRSMGLSGLPAVPAGAWRAVPAWQWITALAMLVAMPLLVLSAAGVAAIELAGRLLRARRA